MIMLMTHNVAQGIQACKIKRYENRGSRQLIIFPFLIALLHKNPHINVASQEAFAFPEAGLGCLVVLR